MNESQATTQATTQPTQPTQSTLTTLTTPKKRRKPSTFIAPIAFLALMALGFLVWLGWEKKGKDQSAAGTDVITAIAERGPLDVFVESSGSINTRDSYKLVANNKARAALEFAIEEGSRVKPGDVLLKLNSEALEERILEEIEDVAQDALLISDRETGLEINKIEAKTNIESAENAQQAAQLNFQKYESAEKPQKIREAELELRTSESDLIRHKQRLDELRNLLKKQFVTESEVEEQELVFEKEQVALEGAKLALEALRTFEIPVSIQGLTNKIDQATLDLRKAEVSGRTKIALAERALLKAVDDHKRSQEKLAELIEQREAYEYLSPVAGIVFYGDTGVSVYKRIRTLEVGEDISPGQVLMTIPIDSAMKVEIQVTEADIRKVRLGQKAEILVDAAEGSTFIGEVEKVAEAATDQGYFASGIKEFSVTVGLKDKADLRQGYSCNVRLLIEELEDVVKVPIQGVFKDGDQYHVYLRNGETRPVTIGSSSTTHVQITDGLEADEEILLVKPRS